MKLLFVCLTIAFVFVRSEKDCQCSVLLMGDGNVFVAYEEDFLATDSNSCLDEQACANTCGDLLYESTNHGDLNYKPDALHGMKVGDYGCMLFGTDIKEGHAFGYSKLCDNKWMYTNFTFIGAFCCVNGKHVKNAQHCG